MPQPSAPKDIEKMVYATAKAMALAEHSCGTPRMVKLYIDDTWQVLLGLLPLREDPSDSVRRD
jgi:hypothetical protein